MFGIQLDVALAARLVRDGEETTVSLCIWGGVSNVSSFMDCSERLGDHLQRSSSPKSR